MEAPTIAGLAAAIERRARPSAGRERTGRLVAIQPDGTGIPLFCTPPLDGSLVGFGLLSHHLGPDQPLWGFGQLAARPDHRPYTVEDMAAAYVEAMRTAWPDGPYLLLGDCFGGFVAYEMACQLAQQREEVALLAMVDTPYRRGWRRRSSLGSGLAARLEHGLARVRFQRAALRSMGRRERGQYARDRVVALTRSLRERLLRLVHRTCVRLAMPLPPAARDVRYANTWAEGRYEPGPFAGRVLFFRTAAPSAGFYPSPLLGWEDLFVGDVRTIELPGEHRSRFVPETLDALARALREELGYAVPLLQA
jgi:thioesterase domain-containing protein